MPKTLGLKGGLKFLHLDCAILHRLERGTSVEDPRPHIDWREEQVLRTLGPKGRWIVRSHIEWREERVTAKTPNPKGK